MRFLLFANEASEEARAFAARLAAAVRQAGQTLCDEAHAEEADLIAVLGGDGTALRALRRLYAYGKPFWIVNCGHLGYLSDCGAEDVAQRLECILRGAYHLEYRTMLGGALLPGQPLTALNEAVFHRGGCAHALYFEARVNGRLALRYRGDGLIVSTPSGSTAYNLSAGGPALMPETELVCLTPVCAQNLTAVPLVVSAHDAVRIEWRVNPHERDALPYLLCDGEERRTLAGSGAAEFGAPVSRAALVRTRELDFCERLQARLSWNGQKTEPDR